MKSKLSFERKLESNANLLLVVFALLAIAVGGLLGYIIRQHNKTDIHRNNNLDGIAQKVIQKTDQHLGGIIPSSLVLSDYTNSLVVSCYPPCSQNSYKERLPEVSRHFARITKYPPHQFINHILNDKPNLPLDNILQEEEEAVWLALAWRSALYAATHDYGITSSLIYTKIQRRFDQKLNHAGFPIHLVAAIERKRFQPSQRDPNWLNTICFRCASISNHIKTALITQAEDYGLISSVYGQFAKNWIKYSNTTNFYRGFPCFLDKTNSVKNINAFLNSNFANVASNNFIRLEAIDKDQSVVGKRYSTPVSDINLAIIPLDLEAYYSVQSRKFIRDVSLCIATLIGLALCAYKLASIKKRENELKKQELDFVATISHELRTPVASVQALAEVMKMGAAPTLAKQTEYADFIISESQRLTNLVENILESSRGNNVIGDDEMRPIAFTKIIANATSQIKKLNPDVTIKLEIEEDFCIKVKSTSIERVFINLMNNSIKYAHEKQPATISISAKSKGAKVEIEIKDNGVGIPKKEWHNIFKKFYRVGEALTSQQPGSGLGLFIVRQIINAHHGEIIVANSSSSGTTFKIILQKEND